MDIVQDKEVPFDDIKKGLEKLGYHHNGDQGINGREVFKRNNLEKKHVVLDFVEHHLYVCHIESEEFQRYLIFRNYLMENEKERNEYENMK